MYSESVCGSFSRLYNIEHCDIVLRSVKRLCVSLLSFVLLRTAVLSVSTKIITALHFLFFPLTLPPFLFGLRLVF